MKTKGVNLELLVKAGATDSNCVDAVIGATDFERLIASAKKGDRAAAKELLALASGYLGHDLFGPMPPELRRYLARAFAEVSLGKPPDVALNLKKTGRPRFEQRTKLRIGHLIYKRMTGGKTLEAVSFELATEITDGIKHCGKYFGFKKAPDTKTLEGIYNEVRLELEDLYHSLKTP